MADPVVDEIYERRLERGHTLRGFAELSGVTKDAVSEIERGARDPRLSMLRRLLDALDLDLAVVVKERQ